MTTYVHNMDIPREATLRDDEVSCLSLPTEMPADITTGSLLKNESMITTLETLSDSTSTEAEIASEIEEYNTTLFINNSRTLPVHTRGSSGIRESSLWDDGETAVTSAYSSPRFQDYVFSGGVEGNGDETSNLSTKNGKHSFKLNLYKSRSHSRVSSNSRSKSTSTTVPNLFSDLERPRNRSLSLSFSWLARSSTDQKGSGNSSSSGGGFSTSSPKVVTSRAILGSTSCNPPIHNYRFSPSSDRKHSLRGFCCLMIDSLTDLGKLESDLEHVPADNDEIDETFIKNLIELQRKDDVNIEILEKKLSSDGWFSQKDLCNLQELRVRRNEKWADIIYGYQNLL